MVLHKSGDITKIKSGIILHQVNCQDKMGSGVAKALYNKWPKVKTQYHLFNKNKKPLDLLGKYDIFPVDNDITIVNSYSQLNYGYGNKKYTDEQLLISNIRTISKSYPTKTIYIPFKIGAGLGGGNWNIIYSGIKNLDNVTIIEL
jgi:hypothetical protein